MLDFRMPPPWMIGVCALGSALVFLLLLNGYVLYRFGAPLETIKPWTFFDVPESWKNARPDVFAKAPILALCGAGIAFLGLLVLAATPPAEAIHGDARWATKREIRKAGLLQDQGMIFGKLGSPKSSAPFLRSKLPAYSNFLLVAPPDAGKTAGVVIPTLLAYGGSAVVFDPKGELFGKTARRRASMGDKVYRFSPYDEEGRTHRWNPMEEIARIADRDRRYTQIRRLATYLIVAKGKADEPFIEGARELFSAVAFIASESDTPTLGHTLRLLSPPLPEEDESAYSLMAAGLLALAKSSDFPSVQNTLMQLAAADPRSLATDLRVLKSCGLGAWADPAVDRATSATDFEISTLRQEPASIFFGVAPNDMEALAPVARLFFQNLVAVLQAKEPGPNEPFPVLFVLDEFVSLGKMDAIVRALTTLRSYGGRLMLVVQGLPNLDDVYGKAARESIMNACQLQGYIWLNDATTKADLSRRLGEREVSYRHESQSRSVGRFGLNRTWSIHRKSKRLLSEDELGQLGKETILLVSPNVRPIKAHKVRYYEDRKIQPVIEMQRKLPEIGIPIAPSLHRPSEVRDTRESLKTEVSGSTISRANAEALNDYVQMVFATRTGKASGR